MGLRDHFRPPLHPPHQPELLLSSWTTYIADALNEQWLSPEYLAEEHTHTGTRLEIDVATFELEPAATVTAIVEGVAPVPSWTPPPPHHRGVMTFPDAFEVRVLTDTGGATLVGVIELVSPANKDRPEQRRAFATKCAGFLHQGVSVVIVDVVTTRLANLHNEIVGLLALDDLAMDDTVSLYGAAYRPLVRGERTEVEVWREPCALGAPLPTLPLRLQGDLFVPVDFEATYQEACRRRRIAV